MSVITKIGNKSKNENIESEAMSWSQSQAEVGWTPVRLTCCVGPGKLLTHPEPQKTSNAN